MSSVHTQNPDQASILYIEHYLDVVENLPNHLARIMSRIHEIDIQRTKIANNLDSTLKEYLQNTIEGEKNKKLNNFLAMLVQLQNLSDNKIGLAQNMVDQIDIRTRQLESQSRGASNSLNISQPHSSSSSSNANPVNSYSNLNGNINGRGTTTNSTTNQNSNDPPVPESSNNERNNSSAAAAAAVPALVSASATTSASVSVPASASAAASTSASTSTTITTTKDNGKEPNSTNHSNGNGKRSSRRSHGNKKDLNPDSNGGGSGDERSSTPITTERSSTGKRANKRGMKGAHKNEGKRRKNSYNYNNDSPTAVYGGVDPDEPTYCLCEQVSYGEMICCDNPTCKIEWFHFLCVSLTAIPKGRWFCPNCRGERSNILRK